MSSYKVSVKENFFFLANFIPPLISSFDFDGVKNKSFSTKVRLESQTTHFF